MEDCRTLGAAARVSGAQVIFSSVEEKSFWSKESDLKGPVESSRSMYACGTGAIARDLSFLDHGAVFEKPRLLGTEGVHMSEEGKGIFSCRLAKFEKTVLNYSCRGTGTSIHLTLISAMPASAIYVHSQERDQRSVKEYLKCSTKEFKPLHPIKLFHWVPNLRVST